MTDVERPDPDALLKRVQSEREQARGQLKIFFGFAPGVGKTYAMLESARRLRARGTDVVVGCVETHGRTETAALLEGLEALQRRALEHRGVKLDEFDLDAALTRRPGVVLVDELAHTNAPGSRHERRFQDVLELLDAGIDVHTTLNVQHVESLNDVVQQLTGVVVRETVPDSVLDRADDIELVDLPPDELLERLEQGKVYLPEQASRAAQHFFQRQNLIGLRELALRRTAERVDAELTQLREQQVLRGSTGSTDRVLVCIGPSPTSAEVVRAGRRLADALHAPWHVVWVENPAGVPIAPDDAQRLDEHLKLAESLGASVQRLDGPAVADALITAAQRVGARHLVMGTPSHARLRDRLNPSPVDELLARGAGLQLHLISTGSQPAAKAPEHQRAEQDWAGIGAAVIAVAVVTGAGFALRNVFTLQDQVMLYLLSIMGVSARFSRTASIIAAALSVAAYDFFFVPPLFTFAVSDATHVLTFAMMFTVGLVISTLTFRVRRQERASRDRENRTSALYALSRDLAQTLVPDEMALALSRRAIEVFGCDVGVVLQPHFAAMVLHTHSSGFSLGTSDKAVVRWVLDHRRVAGLGTETLPGAGIICFPIASGDAVLGVLVLKPSAQGLEPSARAFVDAFVQPAALALERARLSLDAQRAGVRAKAEELRATLLSTVSHDLRTPLSAITGAANTLRDPLVKLEEAGRRELLQTIEDESARLERLIGNLLEMTRLESGAVVVKRELVPLEELVASAATRLERVLGSRKVTVTAAPELSLVNVDALLFEQVFVNLFENAAKYTPDGTPIEVNARVNAEVLELEVRDHGPGVAAKLASKVFDRFVRGDEGQGVGLGLAIVKSIMAAHGGAVRVANAPGGGAAFVLTLPRSEVRA